MISKLSLLDERTNVLGVFELDELSGRFQGEPRVVTVGGPGSLVEIIEPPLETGHLCLTWDSRTSVWILSSRGLAGTVAINGVTLRAGETRPLAVANCTITCQGLVFRFERIAAAPTYQGCVRREIPIPAQGLVIGRGTENRGSESTPRLSLDPEIRTVSSKQASIVRREGEVHLINHNERVMYRTKLNGDQGFTERRLVFGDCLQIPGYEYYTFQFNGSSLVHLGEVSAIQARGLGRMGSGVMILADADLDLECGDFVGVLGGSGEGKSTLMKSVCGIVPAEEGEVWIAGEKIKDPSQMSKAGIGYVPQEDIVHRDLTVRQALRYSAQLRVDLPEQQLAEAIETVLRTLGLTEHQGKPVRILSGGQCKRVSIASELIMNPRFLFLDEPTSGLDPQTESDLMTELSLLARNKRMGILCTTHVLQNSHLFKSIVWIHGGRIIFLGKPAGAVRYFLVENQSAQTRSLAARLSAAPEAEVPAPPPAAGAVAPEEISEDELLSKLPKVYAEIARLVQRRSEQVRVDLPPPLAADQREVNVRVAGELAEAFLSSGQRPHLLPLPAGGGDGSAEVRHLGRPDSLRVLRVLLARQWAILRADPLNFLALLAQAVIIGALVGWVNDNLVFQMFITVVATLWFGCSNGAQQIVGELPIFRRERLAGVGLHAYVLSKLFFQTAITSAQALLLFLTVLGTHHLFHPEILATGTQHDAAAERRVYRDLFFAKQAPLLKRPATGSDLGPAEKAAAAIPAEVKDFLIVDADDYKPPVNETRTDFIHPTSLYGDDVAFALLEKLAWFFRIKDNVLDELGVQMVTRPASAPPPKVQHRSWLAFVSLLLGLRLSALFAAAACGVSLGLLISAAVRTPTQSVMWVPLVLIPQILFGGFVVTSPEMEGPVLWFASALPSFNLQRLMDTTNLYGRATPQMTNKTKIPAFLGSPPYEQETVRFTDRYGEQLEKYDKLSEVSKSWQNLIVRRTLAGQRFKEPNQDTVETRRDVLFPHLFLYKLTGPATLSWFVLGLWVGGSYVLVLLNLRRKQVGP